MRHSAFRFSATAIALLFFTTVIAQNPGSKGTETFAECAQGFPDLNPDDVDPVDAAEVEQIWRAPISRDLILVGGVDQRGWARACLIPEHPKGLLEGAYRDRSTWYRGRFELRMGEGRGEVPRDALKTHYLDSHVDGIGLLLYPLGDPAPPRTLSRTRAD